MTTTATPEALTVQAGSAGRVYVLDGRKVVYTARSQAEAEEFIYGPEGYEGPTCSICDGLGHGYPGGRPCPLEDRGWAADEAEAFDRYVDSLYGGALQEDAEARAQRLAAEARATLAPKFHPYLDLRTPWGDANEMAMHAMEAWADRNRP